MPCFSLVENSVAFCTEGIVMVKVTIKKKTENSLLKHIPTFYGHTLVWSCPLEQWYFHLSEPKTEWCNLHLALPEQTNAEKIMH